MSGSSRALLALLAIASLSMAGGGSAQAFAYARSDADQGSALATGDALTAAFIAQLPNRRALTLAEAILIAQSRYSGPRSARPNHPQGNGSVHEIRIIGNDGLVHDVRVDARTGAVK